MSCSPVTWYDVTVPTDPYRRWFGSLPPALYRRLRDHDGCLDGEETENQLFIAFEGTYKQTGGEVRFTGTFEITGGTGVFEDITGEGTITGAFTCLASREATCAQLGVLSDAVFSLQGTFSDPTT